MAIYIPNYDPPSSCDLCFMADYSPFENYIQCCITKEIISGNPGLVVQKPDTCPLIKVDERYMD